MPDRGMPVFLAAWRRYPGSRPRMTQFSLHRYTDFTIVAATIWAAPPCFYPLPANEMMAD